MAIPNWLLGRHVTAVQAHVQTLNESTGALADVTTPTANDLANVVLTTGSHSSGTIAFTTGLLNDIRLVSDKESDNIASVNMTTAHHVGIKVGYTITCSEVLRSTAAACLLANIWHNGTSRYIRFDYARGGNKWRDWYLMVSYSETTVRGKNVGTMTLQSVDNGGGTYTAADR
jgi:hypothetical protein